MSSLRPTSAASCGSPGSVPGLSHSISSNLALETGARSCKRVDGNIFVDVNCLRMLSEIVKS